MHQRRKYRELSSQGKDLVVDREGKKARKGEGIVRCGEPFIVYAFSNQTQPNVT